MSGEKESNRLSVDEEIALLDKILDEDETKIGISLAAQKSNTEVEKYLNLESAQLFKMSAEECGVGSVLLSQFAFHLQKFCNKYVTRSNWAEGRIKRVIADE